MIFNWLFNIFGDSDEKKLKALAPLVDRINQLEPEIKKLSDDELRAKTEEFRKRLSAGEDLDGLLPEAFAAVREASVRTTGMRHFDVQLLGGIVLHQGKIVEMKTGEGKTLAATLPVYLNALSGKGAHVVTVNDYLAKRDSEWMGPIYQALGLTVGVIQNNMDPAEKKLAYNCDVIYGTNNEYGFDFLRDNMATSVEQCVQRELNFAIVDEVDSILVDEARTPLIISGMMEDSAQSYQKADQLAKNLVINSDFITDKKTKNATLSEIGVKKIERMLGIEYLYDLKYMDIAHQITQSLRARHMFDKNVDYVIKDGEIIIVDEFTGRLMQGRRYSDGLHQAIEAKENVQIRNESQTLATITFQNYFRLFNKLAGMTGTAKTEEAEFWKIYGLEVLIIPTNKPLIREALPDVIYKNKRAKFKAVVDEIATEHKRGRPLLVGTISIENSELLSQMLKRRGIQHNVLNAKQHAREAEIIAKAGQKGNVIISTNMAGRGTDIKLGEGVKELGGLLVLGTERHESRRIDNQLRGRSGRQGDPGASRFYVSLEDDLMKLFGSNRIASMMDRLGIEEDTPIEHRMISNAIERAQKKVEEYHFGIRKQVLEFDNVMTKQRETIYDLRRKILKADNLKAKIHEMMGQIAEDPTELKQAYEEHEQEVGSDNMREIERLVMLQVIDKAWIDQLHNMDTLREGIGLRGMGGRDPLVEYKMEGYKMFQAMMQGVREEVVDMLLKVQLAEPKIETPRPKAISYGAPQPPSQKPATTKVVSIGRNDPCPCGSGKKYKKCCLRKESSGDL
ncbi:MAG: preprotein translocase subunit SecA [bacterium]